MRLRRATDADRDAVLALGVAEEDAWFGAAEVGLDEVAEWIGSEGGLGAGVVAVDDGGEVRGFAAPGTGRESVYLADPRQTDALADVLLAWLQQQRADLQLLTFAGDAARTAAFERHGLEHRRSSFTLARAADAGPLAPAEFPDGIGVEPYRLGDDDEAVHRLMYVDAQWGAVPGHAERDVEGWQKVMRPVTSLFLARRDGVPAGYIAGRLLESGRGYVQAVAVAVSERGRGLGRALLLHCFADLERTGARGLALDVEAHNESALGLYRSIGLEVEREWRSYATAAPAR